MSMSHSGRGAVSHPASPFLLAGVCSVAAIAPAVALAVHAVTVAPVVVSGGAKATATVTLYLASTIGTSVLLSSSQPSVATVPGKFSIAARQRSGTFSITTIGGNSGCSTISARAASTNVTQSALISVRPTNIPGPVNMALADTVVGGTPLQGTIIVMQGAGTSGTVQLASSNPAVIVPPSVNASTPTEGGYVGTFPVTTSVVQPPGTCSVITATRGSAQTRALLRVMPLVQG
ncbi:MAG: hypothetical protein ACT4P6_02260 [Gemmatimonadaceae bacterium]